MCPFFFLKSRKENRFAQLFNLSGAKVKRDCSIPNLFSLDLVSQMR